MYNRFTKLLKDRGLTVSDVCRGTGISPSSFSDWKAGRTHFKVDKLQAIADFFGISIEYFITGQEPEAPYYLNEDAREVAEFIFHHPEYKVLFDASRKVKKEDIDFVAEMINRTQK